MKPRSNQADQSPDERQIQREQLILNLNKMERALEDPSERDKTARDLLGSVRTLKSILENDRERFLDQVGHLIEIIRQKMESLNIKIVD